MTCTYFDMARKMNLIPFFTLPGFIRNNDDCCRIGQTQHIRCLVVGRIPDHGDKC